jgi:3-mercaptopyruvate sulfurtransferase SseA
VSTEMPHPAMARFTPRPQPHLLATATEIVTALHERDSLVRLIDTRPAEQHKGQAIWTPMGACFFRLDNTG